MQAEYQLVLSTCPDPDTGDRIARALVDEGLAACVNIVPGLTSIYQWQGRTESSRECLLLIKTSAHRYAALEQRLRTLHPYELPEIVAVPIVHGLHDYLAWITQQTGITR